MESPVFMQKTHYYTSRNHPRYLLCNNQHSTTGANPMRCWYIKVKLQDLKPVKYFLRGYYPLWYSKTNQRISQVHVYSQRFTDSRLICILKIIRCFTSLDTLFRYEKHKAVISHKSRSKIKKNFTFDISYY